MKIGKKHKVSGTLKVLLGLAGAGLLLFASCQNIFDIAEPKKQEETGFGYVAVSLGEDAARTTRPDIGSGTTPGAFSDIEYIFTGLDPATGDDLEIVKTWKQSQAGSVAGQQVFLLPAGKYRLDVVAYQTVGSAKKKAATGVYAVGDGTFQISSSQGKIDITVLLTPVEDEGNGTLKVEVKIPSQADYVFKLQQYVGKSNTLDDSVNAAVSFPYTIVTNIKTVSINGKDDNGNASNGSHRLPPGSYLLTGKINLVSGSNVYVGGFSEALHIVSNLETKVEKDFVDETKQGPLAVVSDPVEAVKFLQEQLTSWINPVNKVASNPANVLATINGVEFLTGSDGVPTIRLNYLGSEMAKLADPSTFPITLQGGWKIATNTWGWTNTTNQSWSMGPAKGSTIFKLVNNIVGAENNDGVITYTARCTVELRAVAEFRVVYGKDVPTSGRGITIKDGDGADVPLVGDIDSVRKGIAAIKDQAAATTMNITVQNAALRINEAPASVPDGGVYPNPTVSDIYNIEIYETAAAQFEAAVARLKREISNQGKVTGLTAWVTTPDMLAKVNWQDDTKTNATTTPAPDYPTYTTLYYVAERLVVSTTSPGNYYVEIQVPRDDLRWQPVTPLHLGKNDLSTANDPRFSDLSQQKTVEVSFIPWGGTVKKYNVAFKPVAEFEVDFYPETFNAGNPNHEDNWDKNPLIPSTGKVSIKDAETGSTAVDFTTTNRDKPHFLLSTSTAQATKSNIEISLTDVAITIDDLASATDYKFTIRNALKDSVNESSTTTNTDVVQSTSSSSPGVYKLRDQRSRVYKINVYPSITQQQTAAIAKLAGETKTEDWVTAAVSNQRIEDFSDKKEATSGAKASSSIVYVGTNTQEPAVKWPVRSNIDKKDQYIEDNGWPITSAGDSIVKGATVTEGSRDVSLKFRPKGGYSDTIYTFKLIRALEYTITYVKFPIGNEYTTGTVKVGGNNPGGGQYNGSGGKEFTDDTPVGNAKPELIGVGASLTFANGGNPTSTNVFRDMTTTHTPATTSSNLSVTVSGGDTKIQVWVYPSTDAQSAKGRPKLRGLPNIDSWSTGNDYRITTVNMAVGTETENKTTIQVRASGSGYAIGDPASGISGIQKLVVPASAQFNNAEYGDVLVQDTVASADFSVQKGTKTVRFKFTPMGATSAVSPVYTFDLVKVARYTVVFKEGPNKRNDFLGYVNFKTLAPGTGAPSNPAISSNITFSTPRVFIGGTGAGVITGDAALEIGSDSVFSTNIDSNGGLTSGGVQGNPGTTFTKTNGVTSNDFTIEVYPKVSEQIYQVQEMLKAVKGPLQDTFKSDGTVDKDVGWFDKIGGTSNAPNTTFVTDLQAVSGNISEIQYWGSTVPNVKIPTDFFFTFPGGSASDYSYVVSGSGYQVETQSSTVDATWEKVNIDFTPIGGSTVTAYSIRVIPVAKYNVVFTDGAKGKITITPPRATGTQATSKPKGPLTTQSVDYTGYLGIGNSGENTTFKIEGAPGDFTDVRVTQPASTSFTGANAGVLDWDHPEGTIIVTSPIEYTIRVSKTK